MQITKAELFDGGLVFFGAVAFVGGEVVLGVLGMEVLHELVSVDFGDDGGGGDCDALVVAVDDGGLFGFFYGVDVEGVDKDVLGLDA